MTDSYELGRFAVRFDYGLALSLFTHLPVSEISRCLVQMRNVLEPAGVFFASFFEAPDREHTGEIVHEPGGVRTRFNADPFHHSFVELVGAAQTAGLEAERIGDWGQCARSTDGSVPVGVTRRAE